MTPKSRYIFLDVFRGIVVVLMLEGHFLRLVLVPGLQSGPLFLGHEILHGLTAPAFIFGAGFTFAIASERKGRLLHRLNAAVFRRFWRAVLLILIGYALHLPFYSLTKTLQEATPEQWTAFLQFDVLQLIGFGLLFLRVAGLFVHREDRINLFAALLTLGIVLATPIVWSDTVLQHLPVGLATAFTGVHGSLFPIFPYGGFLTAGVVTAWRFLRAARSGTEPTYMRSLLLTGILLIPAGLIVEMSPVTIYENADFWYTSPSYFCIRLGLLLLILPLLWYVVRGRNPESERLPQGTAMHLLTRLGIESLFVYVGHLLVLYGSVMNASGSVRERFEYTLTTGPAVIGCALFISLFALAAVGWNYLKTHHAPFMRLVYWWIACVWVGEFIVRPW